MKTDFLPWLSKYELGISEIDNQHKKLVKLINELYEAFMKNQHIEKTEEVINELVKYTEYHFGAEEKYQRIFEYPDIDAHVEKHNAFIQKIKDFQRDYQQNPNYLTFKIVNFLKEWLRDHILIEDQKYADLFKKNGLA